MFGTVAGDSEEQILVLLIQGPDSVFFFLYLILHFLPFLFL